LDLAAQFRQKYRENSFQPLIGISWYSANPYKDMPALEDWKTFMERVSATFVSLQHGEKAGLAGYFGDALGCRFLVDSSVDPMGDRDRFAAQIAALDAVVTIPQTCAHLAGAVGVQTVLLLDDLFHLGWPQIRATTPWYPATSLVRKRNRSWAAVFESLKPLRDRL
jgi:hypothetical protein